MNIGNETTYHHEEGDNRHINQANKGGRDCTANAALISENNNESSAATYTGRSKGTRFTKLYDIGDIMVCGDTVRIFVMLADERSWEVD